MNILVTGFSSFGNVTVNPSETLVELLEKHASNLNTYVFEGYKDIDNNLQAILEKYQPKTIIMFGLASKTPFVRLERFAKQVKGLEGKTRYKSELPLNKIRRDLIQHGIETRYSDDAGNYWCNYLFYKVGHFLKDSETAFGFIHIPNPDKYEKTYNKKLDLLILGLTVLDSVESNLQQEKR